MKKDFSSNPPHTDSVFIGDSQMHKNIRNFNWQDSELGPIAIWPQSLRSAVHIILGSHYPMAIWWGKEMIMFNNDAYMAFMGNKQPASLGQPAKLLWSDIWEVVGPRYENILQTGEAWFADKLLLYNERKGFKEEAYFTFSCSPIIKEDGSVGGIFCTSSEETRQVLSERRLNTLRQIGAIGVEDGNVDQVRAKLISILNESEKDVPFALLYDCANGVYTLTDTTEQAFTSDLHLVPELANGAAWPLICDIKNARPVLLEDMAVLVPHFNVPAHKVLPQRAFALPIIDSGRDQVAGWLIIGISPLLELNDQYKDFLKLLNSHVNSLCTSVKAFEQEKLRNKKLLELDEAKTTFFSNISHEFRTPITLMLGPVEELLENGKFRDEEEKLQLETVRRNGLRLLKQVNYLLNFSSIESGRMKAGYCAVDLAAFTKELGSTFSSLMERAGLGFTINCDVITDPVYIDPEMWEKIIFNLLSNAFKYTLQGDVTVNLKDAGDTVQLIVKDTGVGIAEEELPNIFNRFHKIKNNCGRSYEGSGIGLSMVSELVNMHHGSITVESKPEAGSSFTVTLKKGKDHLAPESITHPDQPFSYTSEEASVNPYLIEAASWLVADKSIAAIQDSAPGAVTKEQVKHTVLLTDDNQDMLAYLKRILQPSYHVLTASNGLEALKLLSSSKIDLVLTDSMMPYMDGIALVQEIRKHPELSTLPVILLSAQAGEEEKLEGIGFGADDYMVKPFNARELTVRIKSQLDIAELRKQAANRELNLLLQSQKLKAELDDILANMSDAFIVLDQDLRYTYINENATKFTKRTPQDFLGINIWDVFPDLEGTNFYDNVLKAKATGKVLNFELYYDTLDKWFDIRVYPYKQGLSMFICDINAKKHEEQARLETETRFKVMADAAPVLIWISEYGSRPVYFNKRWLDYRGRTIEQEQNRGWLQGLHPDDVVPLFKTYADALEQKVSYEIEMRLKGKDGEYHWFLNQGMPQFMPDGSFAGYIGACVDITKRKWAEELLSKYNRDLEERVEVRTSDLQNANNLLEQQIAEKKKTEESLSRSHEQLRALTTHLQVMREEERKYIARELHDELGQSFTALKIDVTLLLKKLSTGSIEQETLHQELQSMMKTINSSITSVREIVATLRPAILDNFGLLSEIETQALEFQKRTSINMELITDLEYISLGKESSIEVYRIMQESMTNIARHAGASEATIYIEKTDSHFCFTVSDNGIGIQPDNLSDIRTFGLLGMHERAERIGATLAFDSEPDKGTKVILEVPF